MRFTDYSQMTAAYLPPALFLIGLGFVFGFKAGLNRGEITGRTYGMAIIWTDAISHGHAKLVTNPETSIQTVEWVSE